MTEETDQQRINRQLEQLLQETRVMIAGVQVLFAFLLVLAFQPRFAKTTDFQRGLFLLALLGSTAATICFIAPAAWHRILFQRQDKRHIIKIANWFLISGLIFLALSMTLALILVCDFAFSGTAAFVVPLAVVPAFAWFWFAAPLIRRGRNWADEDE